MAITQQVSDNNENSKGSNKKASGVRRIRISSQAMRSGTGESSDSSDGDSESSSRLGKRIVDIQGLSSYLGVCINTIYSWVSQEAIPSIKLGRLLRFDLDKIDIWITERERNPKAAA